MITYSTRSAKQPVQPVHPVPEMATTPWWMGGSQGIESMPATLTTLEEIPPLGGIVSSADTADIELPPRRTCSPHNNVAHFVDAADPHRSDWIRTTCRECGKFIGYRRAGL